MTVGRSDFSLQENLIGRSDSQVGRSYSAKLRPYLAVLKQISHIYTYYCHSMEGEIQCSGSRLLLFFRETPTSPWVPSVPMATIPPKSPPSLFPEINLLSARPSWATIREEKFSKLIWS